LGDPNSTGLRWASRLDEAANQLYAIPNHAEGETEAAAARVSPAKLQLIAVRCKRVEVVELKAKAKAKAKSEYVYSVLAVCRTARESENAVNTSTEEVTLASSLAQLALYDERATIESASFRGDKQGLKLIKRRKASLYGQEMLILLAQLVHNLVVWARNWLSEYEPRLAEFGIKVWVRDLFRLPGRVKFKGGRIVKVQLRRGHQYARRFFYAFYHFFAKSEIRLILDEV
jgi:hypothetical protein